MSKEKTITKEETKDLTLNRYDIFPHFENCLNMTIREWLYWHNVMHRHYTHYLDRKVLKPPFDWIVLGDIIYDTKPEVIIEIGAYEGGTTLWMAHMLDAMQLDTKIIGVDIRDTPTSVKHPRISWVIGDCLDPKVIAQINELAGERRGLIIEDSDHKYHITKSILEKYYHLVAKGCYFIVEDTAAEFMNVPPFPGPLNAAKEFVAEHADSFVIDRTREKYIMTYNPMGYLLRTQ